MEVRKALVAQENGTDTLMELSVGGDLDWDRQFELALYGDAARSIRDSRKPEKARSCTMCGSYCAMENSNDCFKDVLEKKIKNRYLQPFT